MDGNTRKGVSLEQVTTDALRLTDDERAELADEIHASLLHRREAVEQAWIAEGMRRLADLEAGRTKAIPGEQVFAELRERLRSCR